MHGRESLLMPLEDIDPKYLGASGDRSSVSEKSPASAAAGLYAQRASSRPLNTPLYQNAAIRTSHADTPRTQAEKGGAVSELRSSPASLSPSAAAGALGATLRGTPASSSSSPAYAGEASLDFQRSLLQQQVQQSQREMDRLKAELQDTNTRLAETRQQSNEQKTAYTSLSHRYSTTVEKLTTAESEMKKLEEHLVKERNQRHRVQAEREEQKLALREAEWECERLQRQLQQLETNKGLDPKEVQRRLEDRSQFIPTVELRRMQTEMQNTHQALVDRLVAALESLLVSNEASQTNFFVARSAVLSAATDVEARLQRAEAALEDVDQQWTTYRDESEKETSEFLLAVMSENKDLWQQLTLLQNEYDVVVAEMKLKSTQGGSVSTEEHAYVQRQLGLMTERLSKAQHIVESQTILARAHEAEMAELLEANDAMQRRLEELEHATENADRTNAEKSAALAEADSALRDATTQIEDLQGTVQEERQRTEAMIHEMKATQQTMQAEYDGRVRQLEHDCGVADDTAATLQHTLDETAHTLDAVERQLEARTQEVEALRQQTAKGQLERAAQHREELQQVQAVMQSEVDTLRRQLEEAEQAARAASRQHEDTVVRESAAAASYHALEQDLAHVREELEKTRTLHKEATELRHRAQAEVDQLRASFGEGSTLALELKRRVELLEREKQDLTTALNEERAQQEQRYTTLHADWRAAEKARASLQEEVKTLRTRCGELETANMTQERHSQDKEQLMRENLRLHEQYQLIQKECTSLREEVKALKLRGDGDAQWTRQLEDLQRRLRELPELRQSADAARRDALTAKEETELLRRERDQLAQKLDVFLEDAKQQSKREDDFERVCREASAAAQRVGGIVSSAKESSTRYHVFRNTNPTAARAMNSGSSAGAGAAAGASTASLSQSRTSQPRPSAGTPRGGQLSPQHQQQQRRSPMHANANVSTGDVRVEHGASYADPDSSMVRSATSSPSRPWH